MGEGLIIIVIVVGAAVLAIRPWYRSLTGKEDGCVNCVGRCSNGCVCAYPKAKIPESASDNNQDTETLLRDNDDEQEIKYIWKIRELGHLVPSPPGKKAW